MIHVFKSLFYAFAIAIYFYGFMILMLTLSKGFTFKIIKSKIAWILYIFLCTLIGTINYLGKILGLFPLNLVMITSIISIAFIGAFVYYFHKISLSSCLVSLLFTYLYVIILEIPLSILFVSFLHIRSANYYVQTLTGFYFFVCFTLLAFIIHGTQLKLIVVKVFSFFKGKSIIILPIILILTYFLLIYPHIVNSTLDFNIYTLYYSVVLVILIITLFYYYRKSKQRETQLIQNQMKELTDYTKNLDEMYLDIRQYKHDINNILLSLDYMVQMEEWDKLKEYMTKVLKYEVTDNKRYALLTHLNKINHTGIRGLFYRKFISIPENIDVNFKLDSTLDTYPVDDVDLIRALGILLDNAIEAAKPHPKSTLSILITNTDQNASISIVNPILETQINDPHFLKKSTKGKNRGLGLNSLQTIINRNPSLELETSLFSSQLQQTLVFKLSD